MHLNKNICMHISIYFVITSCFSLVYFKSFNKKKVETFEGKILVFANLSDCVLKISKIYSNVTSSLKWYT